MAVDVRLEMNTRTVAVTGGGDGIGAAVSRELARLGAHVVVVDPGRTVRGEPEAPTIPRQTVAEIVASGGRAELAEVSVTDGDAVRALFADVVAQHGALDAVVHAAGTLRMARIAECEEADWTDVMRTHFDGYLNVLAAALPIMTRAGYGRVIGFTSGVGLTRTIIDGPSYGAAKRAIAALTWQAGPQAGPGVTINCLSPIAATRMVRAMLSAGGRNTEGIDLSAMTQPPEVAPTAAYLVSEAAGWCTGQVLFSVGSELSLNTPGALVEAIRLSGGDAHGAAVDSLIQETLLPAYRDQRTAGGYHPRVGDVFHLPGHPSGGGHSVVVGDDAKQVRELASAFTASGTRVTELVLEAQDGAWSTCAVSEARLAGAHADGGPIDAVVVLRGYSAPPGAASDDAAPGALRLVDEHRGVTGHALAFAGWTRAAARYAREHESSLRAVLVTRTESEAGDTAAQIVTQLARNTNETPFEKGTLAVLPLSWRAGDAALLGAVVDRLVNAHCAAELAGADLALHDGWLGLSANPGPAATLSCGTDGPPEWLDDWLRAAVTSRRVGVRTGGA
jgi:NAD(P)-dependent dehydrogenase (short-subunit alcohol dehydrogenase family)